MDYKELIDILQDETNPNILDYIDDAVTAINGLIARTKAAEARAGKAERERGAAVKDLERIKSCTVCKHCDSLKTLIPKVCQKCSHGDKWEWRGKEE